MSKRCTYWCSLLRHALLDIAALTVIIIVIMWYAQSKTPVVELIEPPRVILETREYFEVRWHTRLLLPGCPTEGYPVLYTPFGSEHLPRYAPLYSTKDPQQFVRRYPLPAYLVALHDVHHGVMPHPMELRLTITARCNPFWPSVQVIVIPFEIPVE